MGHSVIGKIVNPIGAIMSHKENKAKKEAEKQQAEAEAKLKRTQENSEQAARKSRSDNIADLEGLQGEDDGGMPGGDLAGLGEGGAYTLKKRKTLGGQG